MNIKIDSLNKTILKCKKCPRLVNFVKKISTEKRKQNINETYWGKPVTGFGTIDAKILIIGLAPAAHGGTRTGRVFTGDRSGDFLFRCLHKANISNQSYSVNRNDGLKLKSTYITNILKCVPPYDRPKNNELNNCSNFFDLEVSNLKQLHTIVALGKVAFDNCVKYYKKKYSLTEKFKFIHGKSYRLPNKIKLIASYHPSPRNVNTKLISEQKMTKLFKTILKY